MYGAIGTPTKHLTPAEPNKFVGEVHNRMPVLLTEKDFDPWLSGVADLELLKSAPEDMQRCRCQSGSIAIPRQPMIRH